MIKSFLGRSVVAAVKRHKTQYPGVFFIESSESATGKPERIYYIRYYKKGKSVEEKAGRQHKDNMTPAKASRIRVLRLSGKMDSNNERRDKLRKKRERLTLNRIWEAFFDYKQSNKSIKSDRYRWNRHLREDVGDKLPDEVTTSDVDATRKKLEARGLAPATVKQALVLLKRVLNFGAKRGLCTPVDVARIYFDMPKVNNIRTEDLSEEQLERLLDVLHHEPDRTPANIMLLALFTGMRRGEIFRLEWEHVDFERGFIFIKDPKGMVDQHIPMNSSAREVLLEQLEVRRNEYVFYGRTCKPIRDMRIPFRNICDKAGLPKDFRPMHGLRHVFASTLASSGKVDMYTLQKLLTHKSPQMVQRYAHLRDEALIAASESIGDLMKRKN